MRLIRLTVLVLLSGFRTFIYPPSGKLYVVPIFPQINLPQKTEGGKSFVAKYIYIGDFPVNMEIRACSVHLIRFFCGQDVVNQNMNGVIRNYLPDNIRDIDSFQSVYDKRRIFGLDLHGNPSTYLKGFGRPVILNSYRKLHKKLLFILVASGEAQGRTKVRWGRGGGDDERYTSTLSVLHHLNLVNGGLGTLLSRDRRVLSGLDRISSNFDLFLDSTQSKIRNQHIDCSECDHKPISWFHRVFWGSICLIIAWLVCRWSCDRWLDDREDRWLTASGCIGGFIFCFMGLGLILLGQAWP